MTLTEFHYFCADAISVSEKLSASVDDRQAEIFLKNLFSEYEKDGSPKNRKKWLSDKLKPKYIYMEFPPKWAGEPRWPYLNDEPMIFLHQFKVIDAGGKMEGRFKTGDTVFVFGSKEPPYPEAGQSWRVVYRMVVQTEEGEHLHL